MNREDVMDALYRCGYGRGIDDCKECAYHDLCCDGKDVEMLKDAYDLMVELKNETVLCKDCVYYIESCKVCRKLSGLKMAMPYFGCVLGKNRK